MLKIPIKQPFSQNSKKLVIQVNKNEPNSNAISSSKLNLDSIQNILGLKNNEFEAETATFLE